jgi:hypothetical protein
MHRDIIQLIQAQWEGLDTLQQRALENLFGLNGHAALAFADTAQVMGVPLAELVPIVNEALSGLYSTSSVSTSP